MGRLNRLISSILAGVMIGVGGLVYLSCENVYIGSVLFSIGLLTILVFKLDLFTGKVGYITTGCKIEDLIIIWIGNFIGAYTTLLCKHTRLIILQERLMRIINTKENDTYLSLFILGMFCGLLMFIAVHTFNTYKHPPINVIVVVFCVSTFILIGFEHCVADMFYFIYANRLNEDNLIRILIISLGNSAGANIMPICMGGIEQCIKH